MTRLVNGVLVLLCLVGSVMILGHRGLAQSAGNKDIDSQIESLRADLRKDKVDIVSAAMRLNSQEAAVFWPMYRRYEAELTKLNDERVQVIRSYAEKFNTLTDAEAKALAERSFDFETRRNELRKRYFAEFTRQLPATTAAKFFQLEHRLDLLVDLKIASELPLLLVKPPAQAQPSQNNPSQDK